MIAPLPFVAGALAWSASEYAIHRYVGHGPRRRRPEGLLARLSPSGLAAAFNEEHLAHHTDPTYFAPTKQKLIAAASAIGGITAVGSLFIGPRRAFSFALGFAASYAAYEIIHRRCHTHAPRNRYGRWVRRHHLHHHHKTPRTNHGVVSSLWDHVVGTYDALAKNEPLRIPRKVAPAWLLDENGEVREELRADYTVVGPARRTAEASASASV